MKGMVFDLLFLECSLEVNIIIVKISLDIRISVLKYYEEG